MIHSEEIPFDEYFKIIKGKVSFQKNDGTWSPEVTRFDFHKSDAVAVLLYHSEKDAYILVKQFRYPPVHHEGVDPWRTEIVAGGRNNNESPESAAVRECSEETGYKPVRLEFITHCYVSPGVMSERVHIYFATVTEADKVETGGGLLDEDEDIELVWIPRVESLDWIKKEAIGDAKTILALQWHALCFQK